MELLLSVLEMFNKLFGFVLLCIWLELLWPRSPVLLQLLCSVLSYLLQFFGFVLAVISAFVSTIVAWDCS